MVAKRLRVATVEDAKPVVLSLIEAIELGDHLQILLAQRREIAQSLPEEKGPAKAALHRQLSIISKEIAGLQLTADDDYSVVAETSDETWDGTGY